jgi:hypothetical protein
MVGEVPGATRNDAEVVLAADAGFAPYALHLIYLGRRIEAALSRFPDEWQVKTWASALRRCSGHETNPVVTRKESDAHVGNP